MARNSRRTGLVVAVFVAAVSIAGCGGGGSGAKTEILNLAGRIVAPEPAQALVTVAVGDRSFQTQADASGDYRVDVEVDPALRGALVTLSAKLTGNRAFVELLSQLGTFAEAQSAAGSDGTLAAGDNIRVNLSNLTTAEAALIEEIERTGGKAFTFGAGVDPDVALKLAGALELATTDPANFALPQGTATTLALARDLQTRTSFIAEIQVNAPEALEQAQLSLVSNPDVVGPASPVPTELLAATLEIEGDYPFNRSNLVDGFEFASTGSGRYFDAGTTVATAWSIDGTRIRVQYAQPVESLSFELVDCNGTGEITQQQRRYTENGVDIVRLSATAVSLSSVNTITTPGCPNVPTETRMFTVGKTVLGATNLQNFTAAEVSGRSFSMVVLGPESGPDRLPGDILDFQANGSGAGRFHVGSFSWSVNAGALVISYGSGTQGRYRPVRTLDGVARAVFADYRDAEGRYADIDLSFLRNPDFAFSGSEIPGRYFQFGLGEENGGDPRLQGFRLRFDADGRGSEESDFIDSSGAIAVAAGEFRAFRWTLEGSGELAVRRFRGEDSGPDCDPQTSSCVLWDERIIVPVNRVGERFYVLERRRSDFSAGVDAADPQSFLLRFYDRVPGSASGGAAKSAAASPPRASAHAGPRVRD